jgi:hypothetical protein
MLFLFHLWERNPTGWPHYPLLKPAAGSISRKQGSQLAKPRKQMQMLSRSGSLQNCNSTLHAESVVRGVHNVMLHTCAQISYFSMLQHMFLGTLLAAVSLPPLRQTLLTALSSVHLFAAVFSGLSAGKGYVDVSTIDPATAADVAAAVRATGALYLEAPVSGSKGPAEQGALIFLTAGMQWCCSWEFACAMCSALRAAC